MVIRLTTQDPRADPETPPPLSAVAHVQATTARCGTQGPCPLKAIRERECPRLALTGPDAEAH